MTLRKKLIADLLFGVQVACAFALGVNQFVRAATCVEGVTFAFYATCGIFFALNFVLAIRAHQIKPSPATVRLICLYGVWAVMMLADMGALYSNGAYQWSRVDAWSFALAGAGTAATLGIARRRHVAWSDPFVKGWVASFCKAMPQFLLAVRIVLEGRSAGLTGVAVVAGYLSMALRGGELWFAIRKDGSDRNLRASALSELANLASWSAVTLVWFFA